MPRISSFQLVAMREQPALVFRTTTHVEKLPGLIAEHFAGMGAYLAQLGELPADVPFVAYHNLSMENLEVELGFPTARELPGQGDWQTASIPAGRAVYCLYRGPYEQMGPVYAEMAQWIADRGERPTGVAYECYFNSPEVPAEELLTKVLMPLQ